MPFTNGRAPRRLYLLDVGRERVASRAELLEAGIPGSTISHRIGPAGPWQRLLPGVALMHRGTPTRRERLIGSLVYAGPDSMITGLAALELYGVRTALALDARSERPILVLVPHDHRRQGHRFVVVERTRQPPEPRTVRGLSVAPPARALVDACRRLERLDDVRNLASDALQNGGVELGDLVAQLAAAARQRTAPARAVVDEMGSGVRFAAEARARLLIRESGMPEPLYNVDVLADEGQVIVTPDGYYPEWGCGYQLDSRRWHLTAEDYERTVRIRTEAAAAGIMLSAVTPALVLATPDAFLAALSGLVEANRHRLDVPQLRIRPARRRSPAGDAVLPDDEAEAG
jgi:hypothetical protein